MLPEIDAIAADHRSGAMDLAARAARVLAEAGREEAIAAVRRLRQVHPAMAPFAHLERAIREASHIRTACLEFAGRVEGADARIAEHAIGISLRPVAVLTLSFSRTVLAALRRVDWDVIVCESRPLCEGVELARRLAAPGREVTVIADAAAPRFMHTGSMVWTGADTVTPEAVVNKIGTYALALCAHERGIPAWVLASELKFGALPPEEPEKDPAELVPDLPPGVRARNVYFETTPLSLFTGMVTERGVMCP